MATVTREFGPGPFYPFAANVPELITIMGTGGSLSPNVGWAFADSTQDDQVATERWFAANYGSGDVTVIVDWYSRSGSTTGAVVWGAALEVITPGDAQSVETDSFATENTQTTTVNGTARGLTRSTITVTNLDSLAANDSVRLRIRRLQSNGSDTMTGDAIMLCVTVQYSDT